MIFAGLGISDVRPAPVVGFGKKNSTVGLHVEAEKVAADRRHHAVTPDGSSDKVHLHRRTVAMPWEVIRSRPGSAAVHEDVRVAANIDERQAKEVAGWPR